MRVRCSPGQLASMKHWGTDRHRLYLDQAVTVGSRRDVSMPYAGWLALADTLKREAFTKWGKGRPSKLVGDAKGTRSALHSIEKHAIVLAQHPALRGYSLYGCSEQMMTVWPEGPKTLRDRWSLSPVTAERMVVLYPEFYEGTKVTSNSTAFQVDLTTWHPVEWDDSFRGFDLFPEVEHLNWRA